MMGILKLCSSMKREYNRSMDFFDVYLPKERNIVIRTGLDQLVQPGNREPVMESGIDELLDCFTNGWSKPR